MLTKKQVYIIDEECHGAIGVATSPLSAVNWLIDEDWITGFSEFAEYHGEGIGWTYTPLNEYAKAQGYGDNWEQFLRDNVDDHFLEDHFLIYLRQVDLADEE